MFLRFISNPIHIYDTKSFEVLNTPSLVIDLSIVDMWRVLNQKKSIKHKLSFINIVQCLVKLSDSSLKFMVYVVLNTM